MKAIPLFVDFSIATEIGFAPSLSANGCAQMGLAPSCQRGKVITGRTDVERELAVGNEHASSRRAAGNGQQKDRTGTRHGPDRQPARARKAAGEQQTVSRQCRDKD